MGRELTCAVCQGKEVLFLDVPTRAECSEVAVRWADTELSSNPQPVAACPTLGWSRLGTGGDCGVDTILVTCPCTQLWSGHLLCLMPVFAFIHSFVFLSMTHSSKNTYKNPSCAGQQTHLNAAYQGKNQGLDFQVIYSLTEEDRCMKNEAQRCVRRTDINITRYTEDTVSSQLNSPELFHRSFLC